MFTAKLTEAGYGGGEDEDVLFDDDLADDVGSDLEEAIDDVILHNLPPSLLNI